MTKEIAIITIHGMGDTNPNYYKALASKLKGYVGKNKWQEKVHLESIFYQNLLQNNQEDYWNNIDDKYQLKWDFLRKFMLYSFSDAASIEHSLHKDMTLYLSIHQKIASAFDNALEQLGDINKPVIIIAHSLGCEQISNYIWDASHEQRFFDPENEIGTEEQKYFRRLNTCKMLVTTGCNIPIFKAGLPKIKLFPRPNDHFTWVNYFDDHDVLAYPIKDMSPAFNKTWIQDKNVNVGNVLTHWNPISHGQYWTDKDVMKPVANAIKKWV
jgi:hypothetical protein